MFFYYCKADFMQGALKMKLVLSFNFTFCYDYFPSLNNSKFGDFVVGAGMLLHINGKFTMRKLQSSLLSETLVFDRPSMQIAMHR
jgi:hypothetical protein